MELEKSKCSVLWAVVLALGLVVLGWMLKSGIMNFKESERVVFVKGLSEKEVKADRVIWPLIYKEAGNDLSALYTKTENSNKAIINFLISNGINKDEITISPAEVFDAEAQQYVSQTKYRYSVTSVLTVVSKNVDLVRDLMSRQGDLLRQGVAIGGTDYRFSTRFSFTGLNEIKPEMIEEATKNARQSAEKFAVDSNSKLGKIKSANQGQFSINDRDENTPYIKTVRVVTTIEYYLKD